MATTYRALQPGYVDDAYMVEGQIFTTDAPKGSWMEEISPLDHDADGKKGGARAAPKAPAAG